MCTKYAKCCNLLSCLPDDFENISIQCSSLNKYVQDGLVTLK